MHGTPTLNQDSQLVKAVVAHIEQLEGLQYTEFVAAGAFKLTYRAVDSDGNSLALKLFTPSNVPERMTREIEAMRKCDHIRICRLLSEGRVQKDHLEWVYLFEDFLPGGTLADRIEQQLLLEDETVQLAIAISEAIEYLEGHRFVHRDIKPHNIMFRDGSLQHPVLVDFGLVRVLNAPGLTQTFQHGGPGTPYFSSPEQLQNDIPLIDWRSDQFSLGVVLYVSHFGEHPFAAASNPHHHQLTVENVRTKQQLAPDVVAKLQATRLSPTSKMLETWPISRYRTPQELVAAWRVQ